MAYTFANWSSQPGFRAQYARLCLHIDEVSLDMGVDLASDGTSANRAALGVYLNALMSEKNRLEKIAGVMDAGNLPGGVGLGDFRA